MTSSVRAGIEASSRTGERTSRRPDVQGLRAVAVLSVIAFHAGLPVPGGFAGVDVFFVISGFVITAMLAREIRARGRIHFGQFYLRRFKRLTPALALMLSVTLLMSAALLGPFGTQQVAAQTGLGAVLLVANFVIATTTGGYFDAPAETNPLLHTWSLSVEEQFYLFFPALLGLAWAGRRRAAVGFGGRGRPRAVAAVALIGALSFGAALLGASGRTLPGPDLLFGFYSPVTRAWEFAVGALVALVPVPRSLTRGPVPTLVAVLGLGAVLLSLRVVGAATAWPGPPTLLPVLGTAAVIVAGADPRGATNPVTALLSTRATVTLGDWSYSLYLWHWPFIVAATMLWPHHAGALLAAALLSVLPAVASYRLLEQPLRRDPRLTGRRLAIAVAIATVPTLVLAAGLVVGSGRAWWSPTVRQYGAAVTTPHAGKQHGCDQRVPLGRVGPDCTWAPQVAGTSGAPGTAGAPLYVVGDSNADHFSEAVIEAGRRLGRPVTLATTNACPFLDVTFRDDRPEWATKNAACRSYVQDTLADLANAPHGTVVLANSDVYWGKPEIAVGPPGGPASTDPALKEAALREGLTATLTRLRAAGHRVLVVQSTPKWVGTHAWAPDMCTTVSVVTGSCRSTMTVADAEAEQGAVRAIVRDVVRATAGGPSIDTAAAEWDTWQDLCVDGVCSTHDGALLRYRDGSHLSVEQSRRLADSLVRRLEVAG